MSQVSDKRQQLLNNLLVIERLTCRLELFFFFFFFQYGYYFFLDSSVDAKLYAQTETSSQHVPLQMRREGYSREMGARGEKEMFELTGVSYVVIKVSPGRSTDCGARSAAEIKHDRVRLDHLLHMTHSLHVLADSRARGASPLARLVQKSLPRR